MDTKTMTWMRQHNACHAACVWFEKQPDLQTAWDNCRRIDWMTWLLKEVGLWEGTTRSQYNAIRQPSFVQYKNIETAAWIQYKAAVRGRVDTEVERKQYQAAIGPVWDQHLLTCCNGIRQLWQCPQLT